MPYVIDVKLTDRQRSTVINALHAKQRDLLLSTDPEQQGSLSTTAMSIVQIDEIVKLLQGRPHWESE